MIEFTFYLFPNERDLFFRKKQNHCGDDDDEDDDDDDNKITRRTWNLKEAATLGNCNQSGHLGARRRTAPEMTDVWRTPLM